MKHYNHLKPRIRSKSKAQADEKAQQPWDVSILKRLATQLLGLRWGFEMTYTQVMDTYGEINDTGLYFKLETL